MASVAVSELMKRESRFSCAHRWIGIGLSGGQRGKLHTEDIFYLNAESSLG